MKRSALKKQIISTFKSFNPEKIILFGSVAGGGSDEMSDVDLILVYNTDKRFMSRLRELYMSWDIPKAVDILAYTPAEFEEMARESLFMQEVMKTAEVIYERP
jgi:predicted nucleotidyltransferase